MRRALAGAWAIAVVVASGCKLDLTGATCNTSDNCPVRQFCSVPLGSKQGNCQYGPRVSATLTLSADPSILPAGSTTQAVASLGADGGPPVPDGGLVTELVDWSVDPGGEAIISVSNDAGTRGLVQALAPGQATLSGNMVFSEQPLHATTTIVVSNAALNRIVPVADRISYAAGTAGAATATGFFSDGSHADLTPLVKWTSSAPSVVTVSGASGTWGRLAALAPGQAQVRAAYQNLTGMTTIVVDDAMLVGLALSPLQPRGLAGTDVQLEATGLLSDGTAQTMTLSARWSVDDQTVAYVGAPGTATLVAPGSTTVRAVAGSLEADAPLVVASPAPLQLEIAPAYPDPLLVDSTLRLSAWATHQDGTVAPADVDWSSGSLALAVSTLGDLTAQSPGVATVTAAAAPLDATVAAEATADAGISWLVWPPDLVVPVGAEGALVLERTHGDGTVQDLTATAGWRQGDSDAGTLVDVETGETGGTVRPRQAGTRVSVLAVVPGRVGRAFVRAPAGSPTLEIVPPFGVLPASGRTYLAAVGHWPDGTVVDLTRAASWSAATGGVVIPGDGPGAGLVLGADAGSTTVQARFGAASAQVTLVSEPEPGLLEVWPPTATLAAGTALPLAVTLLTASGEATDATPDAVWISSAPKVALVTNAPGQQGQLLGRSPGSAVMTVRLDGLVATLRVQVTGALLQAVQPQPPAAVVTWAPVRFGATGHFSDGTTADLTGWVSWSASDPAVLRLRGTGSDRGIARGLDAGVVTVAARPIGGPVAGVPVTVTGAPVASVSVTAPTAPVAAGTRPRVSAVAHGADGTTVDVTALAEWSSSAPGVATVSSVVRPGWVTALQPGTATLTVRFAGLDGGTNLEVVSDGLTELTVSAPASLAVGAAATARATATLSGGGLQSLGEDVVWSSDAPAVLAVSNAPGQRGRLLALGPGTANVRAQTRPGLSYVQGSAPVTVSPPGLRRAPPEAVHAAPPPAKR